MIKKGQHLIIENHPIEFVYFIKDGEFLLTKSKTKTVIDKFCYQFKLMGDSKLTDNFSGQQNY